MPERQTTFRHQLPLYLMEGAELAIFMFAASVVDVLLYSFHPIANPTVTRFFMGLGMGLTALALIKCPWGKRSGAQFNPAVTLAFLRLGKISRTDATFYILAHFLGAIIGVGAASLLLGPRLSSPQVRFIVTVPGPHGVLPAFAAEFFMAALLMGTVLYTSGRRALAPFTPYLVGTLITFYVLLFAPVSGFSINPARTVGSAVFAHVYTALWIYFAAPVAGMLLAAELYLSLTRPDPPTPGARHYLRHRHLTQRTTPKL